MDSEDESETVHSVFDSVDSGGGGIFEQREILQNRTDAFAAGILDDGVIPRAAALSAKEHGDARKAMRLFGTLATKRTRRTPTG
ncbi:hypothetical protein NDI56_21135 [Haloarcula sp. S1CR25-12]|uniref:Cdc6 AAA+ ATPase-type lid domain-containing protein n=1 Tax=Haloarcula saliterrae TaxID=2950534 RepID=A0ABU2FI33_9EURY|nr:hypothetical protein [Haloarcula sp. S1CR25-12]MDS0261914.1 hypothetical protein [Haloarcula sp. S1CR25-12]